MPQPTNELPAANHDHGVYALAQLTIHDRERYLRYARAFGPVLAQYGGTLLVADSNPQIIEGSWQGDKVVLLRFPSEAALTAWHQSEAYVALAAERRAATAGPVLLLRGVQATEPTAPR